MKLTLVSFCIGWAVGAALMWWHFHHSKLIRTRHEWRLATDDSIQWNPYNKVVQSHRDGEMFQDLTNLERLKRGLPVPWTGAIGEREVLQPPIE